MVEIGVDSQSKSAKDAIIQAFVSQTAIEAFHERALHGLAWRNVMPADASVLAPPHNSMRCHFCPNYRSVFSVPIAEDLRKNMLLPAICAENRALRHRALVCAARRHNVAIKKT